jgi:hypothetical protein
MRMVHAGGFLTIILAAVRMKLKAVRVTFKYSGPVQRRDWSESPPTQSGGFLSTPWMAI